MIAFGIASFSFISACGATQPPASTPEVQVPLLSLVPAGAIRVLQFFPSEADARTSELVSALFSEESEAYFDASFGLRPEEVREVVVAVYPEESGEPEESTETEESTERATGDESSNATRSWQAENRGQAPSRWVVLLRAERSLRDHARALSSRLNTIDFERDEPFIRRIGHLGVHHREFGLLDEQTAAYGPPTPLMARVFAGASDVIDPEQHTDNTVLFRWFELAPIRLPLDSPLGLVLAQEEHLEVCLSIPEAISHAAPNSIEASPDEPPNEHGRAPKLVVNAVLMGEFPETAPLNLRAFILQVHASPIGQMLLPEVELNSLTIEARDTGNRLEIHLELPVNTLAAGARRAFGTTAEAMIRE